MDSPHVFTHGNASPLYCSTQGIVRSNLILSVFRFGVIQYVLPIVLYLFCHFGGLRPLSMDDTEVCRTSSLSIRPNPQSEQISLHRCAAGLLLSSRANNFICISIPTTSALRELQLSPTSARKPPEHRLWRRRPGIWRDHRQTMNDKWTVTCQVQTGYTRIYHNLWFKLKAKYILDVPQSSDSSLLWP